MFITRLFHCIFTSTECLWKNKAYMQVDTNTHKHIFYWKVKTGYPIILIRISIITKVYYFLCVLFICVFCFANYLLHMCDCQTVSLVSVFFMRSRIILTTVCWASFLEEAHGISNKTCSKTEITVFCQRLLPLFSEFDFFREQFLQLFLFATWSGMSSPPPLLHESPSISCHFYF